MIQRVRPERSWSCPVVSGREAAQAVRLSHRCWTAGNHIICSDNAEIAMQGVERVEIKGHQSDGGESGCDLSGHDSAFAHTFDHKLGFAISAQLQQCQAFFDLIASEMFRRWGNGSCLFHQAAGECRQSWLTCFLIILMDQSPRVIWLDPDRWMDQLTS